MTDHPSRGDLIQRVDKLEESAGYTEVDLARTAREVTELCAVVNRLEAKIARLEARLEASLEQLAEGDEAGDDPESP